LQKLEAGTPNPIFQYIDKVVYRLELDHEVMDECDDYEDEEYDVDDPERPELPIHPNCKCYWEDALTGENLGQDILY